MDYLKYASNEMFSSTQLIRQSKQIFDKLNTKDIEKAVILRDGKPAFILLEFENYEKIMGDYITLKEGIETKKQNKIQTTTQTNIKKVSQKVENNNLNNDDIVDSKAKEIDIPLNIDINEIDQDEISDTKGEIKEFWN